MSGIQILGPLSNANVNIALIAAELVELDIEHVVVEFKEATSKEFQKKYPLGLFPILLTPESDQVITPAAIVKYIARAGKQLHGSGNNFQESRIDMFLELILGNLQRSSDEITAHLFGYCEFDENKVKAAKKAFEKYAKYINDALKIDVYLVGQKLSVADVALAVILFKTLHFSPDEKLKTEIPNVIRHMNYFTSIPIFQKYLARTLNVPIAPKKETASVKPTGEAKEAEKPKKEEVKQAKKESAQKEEKKEQQQGKKEQQQGKKEQQQSKKKEEVAKEPVQETAKETVKETVKEAEKQA